MKFMKRSVVLLFFLFVEILLPITQTFAGEDQVTPGPQVTPSVSEGSIEAAQGEIFVLLGQLMGGEKEKGEVLVEFGNLVKRWGERGAEILISSWNSYLILFARLAVESYQAALWGSEGGNDEEILKGYASFLERLGFSSKLLKLHGRGSESFSKASGVFQFLKERRDFILAVGGKEREEGFDLSEVKYFELSDEQLDQWDLYVGRHELSSGEEMPNQMYRAKLLGAWEGHHKALQSYVKHVESRGLWQMLQGALRGDVEDPNQKEIEGASKLLGRYRSQIIRLGVSAELIQELFKKEKEAHRYAGLLFDEDISQVKWATVGVAMAPLIPLSMTVGVALGLSVKASAVMAGVPMLVMGVKGAGSFVIQGLFDKGHFSGAQFYNDMMPGLTSALPFSAALPLCAGGITAIAATEAASTTMIAKTGISAGQALTAGSFYLLIGYGVIRGGVSATEGILEVVRRDAERGTLLLWDGTVDIAASLLFLKFAGPKARGRSENGGGSSGDSSSNASPSPEVGGGGKYFPERASAAREGKIFPRTQNLSAGGNQPKGDSQATTVALLEEPATLKDLLEIPDTLPPDDILFSGTNIRTLPSSSSGSSGALPRVYPVWTRNPLIDDGKEEAWIVKRDKNGEIVSRMLVRVRKGSTVREIWEEIGAYDASWEIEGIRGVSSEDLRLFQASNGGAFEREGRWFRILIDTPDGTIPEDILEEVADFGTKNTYDKLVRLVFGPSSEIRRGALRMLDGLVKKNEWERVVWREHQLGLFPQEYWGIPTVVEFSNLMLSHPDAPVRKDAEEILIGEDVRKSLRRASEGQMENNLPPSATWRRNVEETLEDLKSGAQEVRLNALEYLHSQLETKQNNDLIMGANSEFNTGFNMDRPVLDAILLTLEDENSEVRIEAARTLMLLGYGGIEDNIEPDLMQRVLESLRKTLRNDSEATSVRVAVANTLAFLFDLEALPEIVQLFMNPLNAYQKEELSNILYQLAISSNEEEVVQVLRKAYGDTPNEEIRMQIRTLLDQIRRGIDKND